MHLRHAIRRFASEPRFTATALLTLALCLGANLTVFAVIDAILLRPLPFPSADQLVTVFNTYPKAGVEDDGASVANYYERRGQIAAFNGLAIFRDGTAIVGETGATARESIMRVSPDFFSTLGAGPILGRAFTDQEMTAQTDNVAIITDGYWREHFNADSHVLERAVRVNGQSHRVMGVLPPDFHFLSSDARLYLPRSSAAAARGPEGRHSGSSTEMLARLAPGRTIAQAQSEIDAHNAALADTYPQATMIADAGFRSIVVSLRADHVAAVRPTLLLVQVSVLFLLLIGSVNLVNLLLMRASGHARDIAIRQSMGASRRQVITGVLVETLVLALAGGVAGLAVGLGGIRVLRVLGADRLPLAAQIAFDGRLAMVALAGTVAIGIAIAVPIAWFAIRGPLATALGIPLLEGRWLSTADSHRAGRTYVIDEDFARRYWVQRRRDRPADLPGFPRWQ